MRRDHPWPRLGGTRARSQTVMSLRCSRARPCPLLGSTMARLSSGNFRPNEFKSLPSPLLSPVFPMVFFGARSSLSYDRLDEPRPIPNNVSFPQPHLFISNLYAHQISQVSMSPSTLSFSFPFWIHVTREADTLSLVQ